jgi:hypothetical protein
MAADIRENVEGLICPPPVCLSESSFRRGKAANRQESGQPNRWFLRQGQGKSDKLANTQAPGRA